MDDDVKKDIQQTIENNDVVLFMKGNKDFPMCGFSGALVAMLQQLNLEFYDVDVMQNDDIRQGIKEYTDWSTIPQLYIKQEFVGGYDIVKDMFENNELQKLLKEKNIS